MAYAPPQQQANYNPAHFEEIVAIFISCKDLIEKDFNSKSDPFVVVYLRDKSMKWKELGRTEVQKDNNYPTFATQFKLEYLFEEEQLLRFDVYDEDKKGSHHLKDHDFLGSVSMPLGEIMHEKGQTLSKKLLNKGSPLKNKKSKKYSSITVAAEKAAQAGNAMLTMQIVMKGLPKMDGMFGKADPYFTISRSREDGKPLVVYKSNTIKSELNPVFPIFNIEAQALCNCDPYRPLIIEVYDWDKSSADDLIGRVETNLNELKTKPQGMKLTRKSKKNKTYGDVNVVRCDSEPIASFLDYLQGGAEISLMCAIDFTGSNGHPNDETSLHKITAQHPSEYQNAIRQIGNIVSVYDFDKKFPVWGFGGWFKATQVVRHDFALNWKDNDPEVHGVFGIEQVYVNAINVVKTGNVALSGPTLFEPILVKAKNVASIAHQTPGLQYMILVILTDGIINDMKQTKDQIIEMANANLPISILIIGIGGADFSAMDELDGDGGVLINSRGQRCKRDIVQFVPIRKYQNLSQLSKETLIEIPRQFLSYTKAHGIKPSQKPKVQEHVFAVTDDDMKQEQGGALLIADNQAQYDVAADPYSNAPLPPGWEKGFDPASQRPYYVNNNTQTTQWEHPMIAMMAK